MRSPARWLFGLISVVMVAGACAAPSANDPFPEDDVLGIKVRDLDFSFVVIGDWGSGLAAEYAVADRMCRWREKHPYDFVFTTGDNIYPDGHPDDFQPNFFKPHRCSLKAGVTWHAALGNHDIVTRDGRPELNEPRFGMKDRNYVVRESGVRFVVWDSNRMPMRWLRKNTRAQEGDLWTVVLFHHPVVSGGTGHGSTPGLREKVSGLFSRRGVDVVFNGHDHNYSVSKPIGGVRYVVTGGGGATLRGCQRAPDVRYCRSRYHFMYVTVDGSQMRIHAVPAKGEQIHSFKIDG